MHRGRGSLKACGDREILVAFVRSVWPTSNLGSFSSSTVVAITTVSQMTPSVHAIYFQLNFLLT